MPSLVDRLQKLAVDAARLAQEIATRDDVVQQMVVAFTRHGLSVTHAGHALFDALGPFAPGQAKDAMIEAAEFAVSRAY